MAITQATGVTFDNFHLEGGEYDELLSQHGTPCELRTASRCACWDAKSEQPDSSCALCYPFGYLYAPARTIKVFGPNRKPTRRIDAAGVYDAADGFFSLPTGETPPVYSRMTLGLSKLEVDDTLTRGKEDVLRFSRVLAVLEAHTSRRNPPTGTPYEVVNVPLVAGTDYSVDLATGRVTWIGNAVAVGGRVVFHCRVLAEWIIWEAQDRNEHGKPLPYKFMAKRLDYLLHPRGKSEERRV